MRDLKKDSSFYVARFCEPDGWVPREKLYRWLKRRGISEKLVLERDNRTDGGVHRLFKHHVTGKTFEFKGNWYSAKSWTPLVIWANQCRELMIERKG